MWSLRFVLDLESSTIVGGLVLGLTFRVSVLDLEFGDSVNLRLRSEMKIEEFQYRIESLKAAECKFGWSAKPKSNACSTHLS